MIPGGLLGVTGLVAAVATGLAYLRPAPPPRQVVGSLVVFRRMGIHASPTPRRRLRDVASLALVVCALGAALSALGSGRRALPRQVLVLWDVGASLGVSVDGTSRHALALRGLRDHLASRPGVPVGLVATRPLGLHLRPTPDPARVLDVARSLPPGPGRSDPEPLLRALCAGADPPELVVASARALAPMPCPTRRIDLGPRAPNHGVIRLMARPIDALGLFEISVATAGDRPRPVSLEHEGEILAVLDADGGALHHVVIEEGAILRARLHGGDALADDDLAEVDLRGASPVRVALVTQTPEGPFATALRAHPRVILDVVRPGGAVSSGDLVIVEDGPVEAAEGRRRVVIDPGEGPLLRPTVRSWTRTDPLLHHTDLEGLRIGRARPLVEGAPLVVTDGGVLVAREADDGGETVRFGFDPRASDLVLREAFVHLVANLVEWAVPDVGSTLLGHGVLDGDETTAGSPPGDGGPGAPPWERLGAVAAFLCLAAEAGLLARRRRWV